MNYQIRNALFALLSAFPAFCLAAGETSPDTEVVFGSAREQQTVFLDMSAAQFQIAEVSVRPDIVVRFVVNNIDHSPHRFAITRAADEQPNDASASEPQKEDGGTLTDEGASTGGHHHDFPEDASAGLPLVRQADTSPKIFVPAETTREMLVRFSDKSAYEYLCTEAGHADAGLLGRIRVSD